MLQSINSSPQSIQVLGTRCNLFVYVCTYRDVYAPFLADGKKSNNTYSYLPVRWLTNPSYPIRTKPKEWSCEDIKKKKKYELPAVEYPQEDHRRDQDQTTGDGTSGFIRSGPSHSSHHHKRLYVSGRGTFKQNPRARHLPGSPVWRCESMPTRSMAYN